MDPRFCAQDILRCDLCGDSIAQMYCNLCTINLCKGCVGEHISDTFKKHDVVPFDLRRSKLVYPQCQTHSEEICEMHCEDCNTPACPKCVVSEKHKRHHFKSLQDLMNSKKESIEKERRRLQETVFTKFEEIVTDVESQIAEIVGEYEKLTSEITKNGEEWHREIDIVIERNKEEINKMRNQHSNILNNHLRDIKNLVADVKQSLSEIEDILKSKKVTRSLSYEIKSDKFTKLPSKLKVTFPVFIAHNNQGQCSQLFGSLSQLSITTEEYGYTMETPEGVSCRSVDPSDTYCISEDITIISTGDKLYSVTCLSDEEIWTCKKDNIMNLFDLEGKLLKSIQTKSGNIPGDIAVTRNGDLIYTDPRERTVNLVKNKIIREVIRLQGWTPVHVCSTFSGDLLVTMTSNDKQSKVVRYSGSTEKQTIQYDSNGKPLYSSHHLKYICENRNLDICVADHKGNALVVVNHAGKLRFRYIGRKNMGKKSFYPVGVTTDSQSHILVLEQLSNHVHVLDRDGRFLSYVDYNDIYTSYFYGLCMDSKDNLIVAHWDDWGLLRIKYTLLKKERSM